jgi:putative transposase
MDTPLRLPYLSDVTDAQWLLIADLVPGQSALGCPITYARRDIVNALLYLARTGCQWRALPHDFPPWPTIYYYFQHWSADGTLDAIHTALREQVRLAAGHEAQPSAGVLDSQTIKISDQAGPRGYDGGKHISGRKRHLLVDTLGLLLVVIVTAANVSDAAGAREVALVAKPRYPRLRHLWADSTYRGTLIAWLATWCRWGLEIVSALGVVHTFVVQKRRWVVERTFGWWTHYRRLSKDYEVQTFHSESWIRLAMISVMLNRLAPPPHQKQRKKPT